MGVEVERSLITDWIKLIFKFTAFKGGLAQKRRAVFNNMVGGHGWESIGNTVRTRRVMTV